MHLLLWMNAMLDFICLNFAKLWGTGRERKIQHENICLHRDSRQATFESLPSALDQWTTLTMMLDCA